MAYFQLEAKPPFRAINGRFRKAVDGLPESIRDVLRMEGRRFIEYAGEEAPGGSSGSVASGFHFRTFTGSGQGELRVYPGKLGRWHIDGTGIYGPVGKVIRPRHAKALHFFIDGEEFFRPWVRGIRPNPIFSRAYRRWLPGARKPLRRVALAFIRTLKGASQSTKDLVP